jgi:hypothetical protein
MFKKKIFSSIFLLFLSQYSFFMTEDTECLDIRFGSLYPSTYELKPIDEVLKLDKEKNEKIKEIKFTFTSHDYCDDRCRRIDDEYISKLCCFLEQNKDSRFSDLKKITVKWEIPYFFESLLVTKIINVFNILLTILNKKLEYLKLDLGRPPYYYKGDGYNIIMKNFFKKVGNLSNLKELKINVHDATFLKSFELLCDKNLETLESFHICCYNSSIDYEYESFYKKFTNFLQKAATNLKSLKIDLKSNDRGSYLLNANNICNFNFNYTQLERLEFHWYNGSDFEKLLKILSKSVKLERLILPLSNNPFTEIDSLYFVKYLTKALENIEELRCINLNLKNKFSDEGVINVLLQGIARFKNLTHLDMSFCMSLETKNIVLNNLCSTLLQFENLNYLKLDLSGFDSLTKLEFELLTNTLKNLKKLNHMDLSLLYNNLDENVLKELGKNGPFENLINNSSDEWDIVFIVLLEMLLNLKNLNYLRFKFNELGPEIYRSNVIELDNIILNISRLYFQKYEEDRSILTLKLFIRCSIQENETSGFTFKKLIQSMHNLRQSIFGKTLFRKEILQEATNLCFL